MVITLLAGLLLAVAGYLAWWAVSFEQFFWLLPAAIALVAAVGLFLRKRWSQYLWFAIALSASGFWLVSVARSTARAGWLYSDWLSSLISLVPGLFLLALCIAGSIAVYKHFRSEVNAP